MSDNRAAPFAYTRDLLDETHFDSTWVEDLSYNDNTKELGVQTKEGNFYVYDSVPPEEFDHLELVASNGDSIGSAVDEVIKKYGKGTRYDNYYYSRVEAHVVPASVAASVKSSIDYPDAVRTEVQYTINGDVKFMKSTKPADEALADYLNAMKLLGIDATLEAVHIYFV